MTEEEKIDKNKTIEYLSDSTKYVGEHIEVFKHLDPEKDRSSIFSIIAARIQNVTNWRKDSTDYIHTASAIDRMFSKLPSRETWDDSALPSETKEQMLINIIRGNYVKGRGDSSQDWWRAAETIQGLYPHFKTIMEEKYGKDVTENLIEADFSLCVLAAVKDISEKAKEQSIELARENIGQQPNEKDGDDRANA